MARRVRYHAQFAADLAERVRWLQRHRPPEQRANLAHALLTFSERVATFPGLGQEVERRGAVSYRVRPIDPLPYRIWYSYDVADEHGVISVLMLLHEAQDRQHFDPSRFDD
ncbi:MAG TPA: type II toxin-antitoxin system RelE/ParE family toxin [Candidatus Limnocylindria bacterium]|nr:type II toxin-antitoxin system RelE/ParE family toxin [Candidatus Limnocylindria bacterium]